MKTDLATSIIAAILGVLIAYFGCNFFIGELQDFKYTSIDSGVDANIDEPDNEVFNYKALNPTVEVYVGDCKEYDAEGNCAEPEDSEENEDNSGGEQENP